MKTFLILGIAAILISIPATTALGQVDGGSPPVTVISIPDLEPVPGNTNGPPPSTPSIPAPEPPSPVPPPAVDQTPGIDERPVATNPRFFLDPVVGFGLALVAALVVGAIGLWYRRRRTTRGVRIPEMHQTVELPAPEGGCFDLLTAVFAGPEDDEVVVRLTARFSEYELAADEARALRAESKDSESLKQTCWIVLAEETGRIELVVESDDGPGSWMIGARLESILTGSDSWIIDEVKAI